MDIIKNFEIKGENMKFVNKLQNLNFYFQLNLKIFQY